MNYYIFIAFTLPFLISCQGNHSSETITEQGTDSIYENELVSFTAQQLENVDLEVETPRHERLEGVITLQGKIDVPPSSLISVSFPLGGYLQSTDLLPGTPVKKGQILAVLEDMQYIQLQQDFLIAKERFHFAALEHRRQQELNASKASSDKVFEQARTEMENQRILMNSISEKLALIGISSSALDANNITKAIPIRSPINGFVSKVNVNVGKYTSPTEMLFELVDPTDLHLSLNVFERDISAISVGQKVKAFTTYDPDKKFEAEIILISRNLNQDRMAEVHCHIERADESIIPGIFMNAEVVVKNNEALTLPEEAVVRWQNKSYVFLAKQGDAFEMTEIEPGTANGGRIQVKSKKIDENTRIVTRNAYSVLMKMKNSEEED